LAVNWAKWFIKRSGDSVYLVTEHLKVVGGPITLASCSKERGFELHFPLDDEHTEFARRVLLEALESGFEGEVEHEP